MKILIVSALVALGLSGSNTLAAPKVAENTQTISGTIQGLAYVDPSPAIEIGSNGRGTVVKFESVAKLQTLGLKEQMLALGTPVEVKGKLKKGTSQDELDADTIIVNGQTFKLKQ